MDIYGERAFLTIREQQDGALASPIDLDGLPIVELLREAASEAQRLEAIAFSDPEDHLPIEKAEALADFGREFTRRQMYIAIANHMMLAGKVDVSEVIELVK